MNLIPSVKFKPSQINARRFFNDWTSPFCAFFGGWGSGKTWTLTRKVLAMHIANAFDDDGRPTLFHSVILAPTYQLATTKNIPELKKAAYEFGIDARFIGDSKKYWFEFPDLSTKQEASKIYIRSADDPSKITAWEVQIAAPDEAARYPKADREEDDALVQLVGRVRGSSRARFKQFKPGTTHEGTDTFVYRRWIESPSANHAHYVASTRESVDILGQDFIDNLVSNMSPELAKQYVEGQAVDMGGASMYYAFDPKLNIDDTLQYNQALPLRLAFDFNTNPGSHAILGQFYPDKPNPMMVELQEFHQTAADGRKLAEYICHWLKSNFNNLPQVNPAPAHEWKFPPPLILYGDAAGSHDSTRYGSTGVSSWQDVEAIFRANNIAVDMRNVPTVNPHVSDRVATVNSVFRSASGIVRFKCRSCCTILTKDFRQMRWVNGEADKSDRKISHMSDALGYKVVQLLPIRR